MVTMGKVMVELLFNDSYNARNGEYSTKPETIQFLTEKTDFVKRIYSELSELAASWSCGNKVSK